MQLLSRQFETGKLNLNVEIMYSQKKYKIDKNDLIYTLILYKKAIVFIKLYVRLSVCKSVCK